MSTPNRAATVPGTNDGSFAPKGRGEAQVYLTADGEERISMQVAAPFERLSLDTSNRVAPELVRMVDNGQLDTVPPYQRPSVWTRDQQRGIVRSWLQGIPIPAITVNDRMTYDWKEANGRGGDDDALWAVIDGKQRIEAAQAWFHGELDVPATWFEDKDVADVTQTDDGPYVTFDQLSKRGQTRMELGGAPMPVNRAQLTSVEEEADLYLLLNGGGTAQTDEDMANASQVAGRSETDKGWRMTAAEPGPTTHLSPR